MSHWDSPSPSYSPSPFETRRASKKNDVTAATRRSAASGWSGFSRTFLSGGEASRKDTRRESPRGSSALQARFPVRLTGEDGAFFLPITRSARFHLRAAFPGYAKATSPPPDVRPAEGVQTELCLWVEPSPLASLKVISHRPALGHLAAEKPLVPENYDLYNSSEYVNRAQLDGKRRHSTWVGFQEPTLPRLPKTVSRRHSTSPERDHRCHPLLCEQLP